MDDVMSVRRGSEGLKALVGACPCLRRPPTSVIYGNTTGLLNEIMSLYVMTYFYVGRYYGSHHTRPRHHSPYDTILHISESLYCFGAPPGTMWYVCSLNSTGAILRRTKKSIFFLIGILYDPQRILRQGGGSII